MEEFWGLYKKYRAKYRLAITVTDNKKGWSVHTFRRNVRCMFLGGKEREIEDYGDQEILFCTGETFEEAFSLAKKKLEEWITQNEGKEIIEGFKE